MDLDHDACYRAFACAMPASMAGSSPAVKTTGIYCRPICPARTPRSENVAFYPTAAAAQEAGFRPCLRCRPETAPDLGRLAGHLEHRLPCARADRAWRSGRGRRRCPGRSPGRGRAAAPAPLSPASRSLAGRGRPDPPRSARQAAHPRIAACRWPRSPSRPASAASAGSTRPSRRCSAARPARCGAQAKADVSAGRAARSSSCCAISRPTTGRRCWTSCAAGPLPASSGVDRGLLRANHAAWRRAGNRLCPARREGNALRASGPLPQAFGPAGHHRAAAACVRPRRRSARDRRPSRQGSGSGAAGDDAAGPARARRLGRLRAGHPGGAGTADHGGRRGPVWPDVWSPPMASAWPEPDRRSDPRVPDDPRLWRPPI